MINTIPEKLLSHGRAKRLGCSEGGSHHFSRMHFQGYTISAQETLETIIEITHWYFAFSCNFVCLEVTGLKAGHYSAFAFAIYCSLAILSQSVFNIPLISMLLLHSQTLKNINTLPPMLRIKDFKVVHKTNTMKQYTEL